MVERNKSIETYFGFYNKKQLNGLNLKLWKRTTKNYCLLYTSHFRLVPIIKYMPQFMLEQMAGRMFVVSDSLLPNFTHWNIFKTKKYSHPSKKKKKKKKKKERKKKKQNKTKKTLEILNLVFNYEH